MGSFLESPRAPVSLDCVVIPSSLPFNTPFGNFKEGPENRESDSLFILVLSKGMHCDANLITGVGGSDEILILQQRIEP
jgi:hypothetical protein